MTRGAIRILVTGGGTGGHLFPAIAVIQALHGLAPHCQVMFAGTTKNVETENLKRYHVPSRAIHCKGLKNMGLAGTIMALILLPWALLEALTIVRRFRPHLVFGVGGYVTGPVLLAARLCKVPVAIHEQNIVPGIANRLASRLAQKIFLSWPDTAQVFDRTKSLVTGNPVRQEIALARKGSAENPTLVVLGGSQGARGLNRMVAAAFLYARKHSLTLPDGLRVIHQTGRHDETGMRATYEKLGIPAEVAPFFTKMGTVYNRASLVVSRAGATTLAELCLLQKPAILIPYPHAADNHQEKNARMLEQKNAAMVLLEKEGPAAGLAHLIADLLAAPGKRKAMEQALTGFAKPEAARTVAAALLTMLPDTVRHASWQPHTKAHSQEGHVQ